MISPLANLKIEQYLVNKEELDTDLSPLYRPIGSCLILDKKVRYIAPSFMQAADLMLFLKDSIAPLIFTSLEVSQMAETDVILACAQYCQNLAEVQDEEGLNRLISRMLLSSSMDTYFSPCIRDSFPDLNPRLLTSDALLEVMTLLLNDSFQVLNG